MGHKKYDVCSRRARSCDRLHVSPLGRTGNSRQEDQVRDEDVTIFCAKCEYLIEIFSTGAE